jgi:hypothetical protein
MISATGYAVSEETIDQRSFGRDREDGHSMNVLGRGGVVVVGERLKQFLMQRDRRIRCRLTRSRFSAAWGEATTVATRSNLDGEIFCYCLAGLHRRDKLVLLCRMKGRVGSDAVSHYASLSVVQSARGA